MRRLEEWMQKSGRAITMIERLAGDITVEAVDTDLSGEIPTARGPDLLTALAAALDKAEGDAK